MDQQPRHQRPSAMGHLVSYLSYLSTLVWMVALMPFHCPIRTGTRLLECYRRLFADGRTSRPARTTAAQVLTANRSSPAPKLGKRFVPQVSLYSSLLGSSLLGSLSLPPKALQPLLDGF